MNIALLSLIGLCIAIIVSGVARVNVGILAMSLAWLIGYYLAGMKVSAIMAGFPIGLATMLFGMTFLFGQAQQNGTRGNLAGRAISLAHGQRGVVPLLFFMLPLILVRFQRRCWVLGVGRAALPSPATNTHDLKPCLEMHWLPLGRAISLRSH